MINILIPLAGTSKLFESQYFPKPLHEINNRIMIEYPIIALSRIKEQKRFIFVLREEDCVKFHLDNTLKLLTNEDTVVIRQSAETKGAVCSCLLAIDYIDNDDPLIISNGDQYLDIDYNKLLQYFNKENADGGVVCFESVHPQWSYAKLDKDSNIMQTAEKSPISRNAIAGFYYFRRGKDFVAAGQSSIEKEASVNGMYFVAPTYNELVLKGSRLKAYAVDAEKYNSFYSFSKIREFEKLNIKI
jgi:NDP-sugar pyrophosphorylase family protein